MSTTSIKPALLAGFQDILPAQMIPYQKIFAVIRESYERFGFVPLETPGMERFDVLTGASQDFNKSIYTTRIVHGAEDRGTDLLEENSALRFDLTVPLARVVAAYPDLPRPFKRYQLGKVWRGEKPQGNRYREFWQFDADIIGSDSILADTEIVELMHEILIGLGLQEFTIRINDRRILNGLAKILGCREHCKELDRMIDKIDSIGVDGVLSELTRRPESSLENRLVLDLEQAHKLQEFLELDADTSAQLLVLVEKFFSSSSDEALEGIHALSTMIRVLGDNGVSPRHHKIDLAVARGLDYYSGPVFETNIASMPDLGSIFSGGRFDGLVSRFIPNSTMPGVGASVGVDRVMTALTRFGVVKEQRSVSKVLVTIFKPELAELSYKVTSMFRAKGIPAELYLGGDKALKAQLGYALRQGIPFVAIIGEEEAKAQKIALKNLAEKKQETLTIGEALDKLVAALKV